MSFRRLMLDDTAWRITDMLGHILMAIVLPGPWWLQFLPDVFVPLLMTKSLVSDKLLPRRNWLVVTNVTMHNIGFMALTCATILVSTHAIKFTLALTLQWGLHILWDIVTHVQTWNRKPIL